MRAFLLNLLIEHYQIILVCVVLLLLLFKVVLHRQEAEAIFHINQLLTPIAKDVLLEKIEPTKKFEAENIAAIKKTLQGIDLNTVYRKSTTSLNQPIPAKMQEFTQSKMKDLAAEKVLTTPVNAAPTGQSQAEIVVNLKRFDAEFENLLSNMEKRAQMRKK